MFKKLLTLFSLAMVVFSGCTTEKLPAAVENFDVTKYMGKWHEFARLPNWFEKGMKDVSAEYILQKNGTVRVINRGKLEGKEKSIAGVARIVGEGKTGELEVSFFRPFYGSYRIIKLAPDYRYSVVCGGEKALLWVLSREKKVSAEDWEEISGFLEKSGFPVEKLIFP